jgi:hypothetical protein
LPRCRRNPVRRCARSEQTVGPVQPSRPPALARMGDGSRGTRGRSRLHGGWLTGPPATAAGARNRHRTAVILSQLCIWAKPESFHDRIPRSLPAYRQTLIFVTYVKYACHRNGRCPGASSGPRW